MTRGKAAPIALTTTVHRSPDPVSADLGGETALMSIELGRYFGMDAVGSDIWQRLSQPLQVSALVDQLCAEYEVPRERCEAEVLRFLEALAAQALIRTS